MFSDKNCKVTFGFKYIQKPKYRRGRKFCRRYFISVMAPMVPRAVVLTILQTGMK